MYINRPETSYIYIHIYILYGNGGIHRQTHYQMVRLLLAIVAAIKTLATMAVSNKINDPHPNANANVLINTRTISIMTIRTETITTTRIRMTTAIVSVISMLMIIVMTKV